MKTTKQFKKGDKVRCTGKEHGYRINDQYVNIGEVYTFNEQYNSTSFTLEESNLLNPDGPLFDIKDFELCSSINEAYDRAMSIL